MKYHIYIYLLFASTCFAQNESNRVFFSDSLNKALVYEGIGLNITQPELWITYELGENITSDTIAIARDSVFIVTYSGEKKSCRLYSDSFGKSFFCITESFSKDGYLSNFGYKNNFEKRISSKELIHEISNEKIRKLEGECANNDYVLEGYVNSIVNFDNKAIKLYSTPFSFHLDKLKDTLTINDNMILKSIKNIEKPTIYKSDSLEIIMTSFDFKSEIKVNCRKNEFGKYEIFKSESVTFFKVIKLRKIK